MGNNKRTENEENIMSFIILRHEYVTSITKMVSNCKFRKVSYSSVKTHVILQAGTKFQANW